MSSEVARFLLEIDGFALYDLRQPVAAVVDQGRSAPSRQPAGSSTNRTVIEIGCPPGYPESLGPRVLSFCVAGGDVFCLDKIEQH